MKLIIPRYLIILFSFCLGFVICYAALLSIVHKSSTFNYITDPVMKEQHNEVISYLTGSLFTPNNLDFYTASERSHMTDVKHLFDVAYISYIVSLGIVLGVLVILIAYKMWNELDELLSRSLRATGWTLLGIMFVLGIASLLDFSKFWLLFHTIFFPQGNWMFASDSLMIRMYPAGLFATIIFKWVVHIAIFSIVAILASYFMIRMKKAEHHFHTSKR